MTNERADDKPKSLGSAENCKARRAELCEPHIRRLTDFVRALRKQTGRGDKIPYFDPWDGGKDAEVLCLFEAPGPQAMGSGFISRNNPDETAKNFYNFNKDLIPRKRTVSWNIVPWYIGDGSKIRAANSQDIEEGLKSLNELLKLLPRLRVVVLFGKKAQRAKSRIEKFCPNAKCIDSPHPSPQFVNRDPKNKNKIRDKLQEVADYLESTNSSTSFSKIPLSR